MVLAAVPRARPPLRIGRRHDAGHHGAVARLQVAVVPALIGEEERLRAADHLGVGPRACPGPPAGEEAGQRLEPGGVARAAAFELRFVRAHHRQLRHGGAELQRGIVRKQRERGLIARQRLVPVAVVDQDLAEPDMRLEPPGLELDRAPQEIQALGLPAGAAAQAGTEVKAGGGVVRRDRQCGPQARDRLLMAAGLVQHGAERAVGGGQLRIEPRRPLGERNGGGGIAAFPERQAEMDMRHRMARHHRDDVAEAIHGGIEPLRSGSRQRGAQTQAQGPAVGIDGAGGLELGDAFAPQALPAQRVAKRAPRRDQLRIEPDGGAQMLDRGRHVAAQADQPSELVMGAGIGGIERDGAAIAGRRFLERAARLQHEGELALRARMVRMRRNELPIKRARLREIAAERERFGTIGQGGGAWARIAGYAVVALVHAGRAQGALPVSLSIRPRDWPSRGGIGPARRRSPDVSLGERCCTQNDRGLRRGAPLRAPKPKPLR